MYWNVFYLEFMRIFWIFFMGFLLCNVKGWHAWLGFWSVSLETFKRISGTDAFWINYLGVVKCTSMRMQWCDRKCVVTFGQCHGNMSGDLKLHESLCSEIKFLHEAHQFEEMNSWSQRSVTPMCSKVNGWSFCFNTYELLWLQFHVFFYMSSPPFRHWTYDLNIKIWIPAESTQDSITFENDRNYGSHYTADFGKMGVGNGDREFFL